MRSSLGFFADLSGDWFQFSRKLLDKIPLGSVGRDCVSGSASFFQNVSPVEAP